MASCSEGPPPELHIGRVEMAWEEVIQKIKSVQDVATAKSAIEAIRGRHQDVASDLATLKQIPSSQLSDEAKKRIEALNKRMTEIMIAMIQLPAGAKELIQKEIGTLEFRVGQPEKK